MPSSYTTSLRLTLPATGELAGQWGNTVNTGITELLDAAVAGTASISTWGGAGVAYTLSNNSGTADEARRMFIVATGTPGEAKNVICPAVSKFYVFRNDTTGGFALTLKTSGGTGIAVPAGQYKFLYCDGTNVVEAFNSAGALTLSGALSVGGTTTLASNPTLSAGTANQVQYLNGSKVLVGSPNMTFNGTDLTVSGAVNAGSVNATTLDLTNLEVTNIKAKDGTASASIADSTGVMSLVANPVLSGGTANGVLYLNGSKVATSGSALTFDGSVLTLAPNQVTFGSSTILALGSGSYFKAASTNGFLVNNSADTLNFFKIDTSGNAIFYPGGTEGMRLTSTGLGIGTSSPGEKLQVAGAIRATGAVAANATGGILAYQGSGTTMLGAWGANTSTVGQIQFYLSSSDGSVNGELMRLTSTGLGIGTSSPTLKLDVAGSAKFAGNYVSFNDNGYIRTDVANILRFQPGSGGYEFRNSSNSGNLAVLDSSGNLGLGLAPSAYGDTPKLLIYGGASSTSPTIEVSQNGTGVAYHWQMRNGNGIVGWMGSDNTSFVFGTGTSTESARITSGGILLVGTTSAPSIAGVTTDHAFVAGTGNRWVSGFRNTTTGTPWGLAIEYSGAAPNDISSNFLYCYDSAPALRMSVRSNGGLANYSANDVNLSDRREKTNFAPAKSYLDTICAIPVQTFNYIDQSEDDPGLTLGVVAQDVQAVAPELVMESNWGTEDDPKMRLSIYQTDLQYALMKCIQELKAQNDELRARVAALESN